MPTPPMPRGVTSATEQAWVVATSLSRLDGLRRARQQGARLGAADQRLMWLLSDKTPRTLRDIALALGLEQSTVNRQVNAALADGLLRRDREPGQTAHVFTATAEGLSRFRHDLNLNLGAYQQALDALPERDAATLVRILGRFVEGYGLTGADDAPGDGGASRVG